MPDSDIIVLPADDPTNKKIGFTVREYLGCEVFKPLVEGGPTELMPLTKEEDIKSGDVILVPGLVGGYYWMTVEKDTCGGFRGRSEKLIALLEFAQDDRMAWVCGGLINTRGIEKLEIYTGSPEEEKAQ